METYYVCDVCENFAELEARVQVEEVGCKCNPERHVKIEEDFLDDCWFGEDDIHHHRAKNNTEVNSECLTLLCYDGREENCDSYIGLSRIEH